MDFEDSLSYAQHLDRQDPLHSLRTEFFFPPFGEGQAIYFCGNSLGLQPRTVPDEVEQELADWRRLGVAGYTQARNPWLYYQQLFQEPMSRLAGCGPQEVTVMNTLSINLHLMMLSFYRPTTKKFRIIMEAGAFPSDQYAVETQVKLHGLDPATAIVEVAPRAGEYTIRLEDIQSAIHEHRDTLALVLFGGINYYSGQFFDLRAITAAAHEAGAIAGFDLAHAIGNVQLELHNWNVDFAVWCSYKYLNAGPGAVGGAYIHERYSSDTSFSRAGGWWGNDEKTRFEMRKGFVPKPDANGWNISTAQVLNMVCLKASLEIFGRTTFRQVREKSVQLTGWLEFLLGRLDTMKPVIITPRQPEERGAQLSLYFDSNGKEVHQRMTAAGIVVDYREPGVIRVAPAPLYNSFEEVYRFYEILKTF